jgi:hypothetical protein
MCLHQEYEKLGPSSYHHIVIRSHNRPALALKTFKLLRGLLPYNDIFVYVEPSQLKEYGRTFGYLASAVLKTGSLGAGANVMSGIYDTLKNTKPGLFANVCYAFKA